MTYLEMCQEFAKRVAISGGTIPSVDSSDRDHQMISQLVASADAYIQSLYHDWSFMWSEATGTLLDDTDLVPAPVDMNVMDTDSLVLDPGTTDAHRVLYRPYREFRDEYTMSEKRSARKPSYFTVRPDKSIVMSEKTALSGTDYRFEYWIMPVRMSSNEDTSIIEPAFSEAGWLIVSKALLDWAARESAPEVLSSVGAQYDDLMARLQSVAGPSMNHREYMRNSEHNLPAIGVV